MCILGLKGLSSLLQQSCACYLPGVCTWLTLVVLADTAGLNVDNRNSVDMSVRWHMAIGKKTLHFRYNVTEKKNV